MLDPVWASAAPATAAPATAAPANAAPANAAPANAAPPSAGDSAAVHGAGTPWRRALALLGEMRLRGMAPDVRTYASAIELSARALMPGEALRLLTTMRREDGLEPNVFCYLAAAGACARAAGIGGAGSPHAALHATAAVRLLWSSEAALARESRDDEDTRERNLTRMDSMVMDLSLEQTEEALKQAKAKLGRTLARIQAAIHEEMARLVNEPVGEGEMNRAQKLLAASEAFDSETVTDVAETLGEYATDLRWQDALAVEARRASVDAASLQATCGRLLRPDRRVVAWSRPEPSEVSA